MYVLHSNFCLTVGIANFHPLPRNPSIQDGLLLCLLLIYLSKSNPNAVMSLPIRSGETKMRGNMVRAWRMRKGLNCISFVHAINCSIGYFEMNQCRLSRKTKPYTFQNARDCHMIYQSSHLYFYSPSHNRLQTDSKQLHNDKQENSRINYGNSIMVTIEILQSISKITVISSTHLDLGH